MHKSRLLLLSALSPLFSATAWAADSADLSTIEMVPPSVIFVVDLSTAMDSPCSSVSTNPCLTDVLAAIDQVARHYDWARFGIVGTTSGGTDDGFVEIVPVGSSYAELSSALPSIATNGSATRNLTEVLEAVADNYLGLSSVDDGEDDDGDGYTGDWDESPIQYSCSTTHMIVFAKDQPEEDDQIDGAHRAGITPDVVCLAGASGGTDSDSTLGSATGGDFQCYYDNVVSHLYNADSSTLVDPQNVVVHTIGLGLTSGSTGDQLYQNAADQTSGDGLYTVATTPEEILSGIVSTLSDIQSGLYSRSSPVISADGAYLIYTFYELTGENPLAQGHVRAYELDNDPTSSTYGQLVYEGPSDYGGAVWDGGDLLVSRLVLSGESNPEDRDGVGQRDIYFFEQTAYENLTSMSSEAQYYGRMGFDADFVDAIRSTPTVLSSYFDTTASTTTPACVSNEAYDLDDDCDADADDMQALVDFVRGYEFSEFRYLDLARGRWKLADSPYSVPIVVTARNDVYSTDKSYQRFIDSLEAEEVPSVVILPANDGMLHAFRLEDDPDTTGEDEAGEELWAWIPGYLLQKGHSEEWASGIIDLMWYGRTFLFDGSPVVEDVWIDDGGGDPAESGNGTKAADGSEWHRVVVVQQGLGGPVTLALDITDTQSPKFLWEQTNTDDTSAMGHTMGRPAIFNVYDASNTTAPEDRWVAMWGGGRAVAFNGTSTEYYESSEPNLYMWGIEDYESYTGDDDDVADNYAVAGDNIGDMHPDLSANGGSLATGDLAYDADSSLEYGYVSAALAVVDVDSDGDADVMYFPITTSYLPADEAAVTGGAGGVADIENPGSSWIYKAIIDTEDPDDLTWCKFYDPFSGTSGSNGIGFRPEVHYAATVAWRNDGDLGVFWGTGTPFDRTGSEDGYFFAMKDTDPLSCVAAEPVTCAGNVDGYYTLDAGEGLTSDPYVYAGVVYFTTYTPDTDRCVTGIGRLYGLDFEDCSGSLDPDGDGTMAASEEFEGIVTSSVGDGGVYVASSSPGDDGGVQLISTPGSDLLGTRAVAWMEVY